MLKGLTKRELGNTGEKITFIGFGALEIGRDWGLGEGQEIKRPPAQQAYQVLNGVLDTGINIIDTARAYHRSEERIGNSISDSREDFFLASKCGEHSNEPDTYYNFSYEEIKKSIDLSLKKLQVDVIDLMQIHFGPEPEKVLKKGETFAAMKDAQKEGKIKYLGASAGGQIARKCIENNEFDVIQIRYNLLNHDDEHLIDLAAEKGIGILIKGGLARGKLTAKAIPYLDDEGMEKVKKLFKLVDNDPDMLTALALNFLYKNRGITSVLIGSKNFDHIQDNLKLLEREVENELIKEALSIVE